MIIIGKSGCKKCVEVKNKYPNMKYIEIPDRASTPEMREIKKKIGKLDFEMYPIVVNDDMTEIIEKTA